MLLFIHPRNYIGSSTSPALHESRSTAESYRKSHSVRCNFIAHHLKYIQLSEVFYILTTTFLKISLGLFFLRLLTQRWQRHIFYTILYISAIYGFFYFLVTIFQCGNPSKLADTLLGSKKCAPNWFILSTGYLYGIVNIVADWTFTLIPIVILLDSDMDRRSKISVGIVMGFAAIGSVSSILRMVYLKGLSFRGTVSRKYKTKTDLLLPLTFVCSGFNQSNHMGDSRTRHRHHRSFWRYPSASLPTHYHRCEG